MNSRGYKGYDIYAISDSAVVSRTDKTKYCGTYLGIACKTSSASHFGKIRQVTGSAKILKQAM